MALKACHVYIVKYIEPILYEKLHMLPQPQPNMRSLPFSLAAITHLALTGKVKQAAAIMLLHTANEPYKLVGYSFLDGQLSKIMPVLIVGAAYTTKPEKNSNLAKRAQIQVIVDFLEGRVRAKWLPMLVKQELQELVFSLAMCQEIVLHISWLHQELGRSMLVDLFVKHSYSVEASTANLLSSKQSEIITTIRRQLTERFRDKLNKNM